MQEMLGLLWSINDRLGGGRGSSRGADYDPPTLDWLNDVCRVDLEMQRQATEAAEQQRQRLAQMMRQAKKKRRH